MGDSGRGVSASFVSRHASRQSLFRVRRKLLAGVTQEVRTMTDAAELMEQAPVQDRHLLQRLSLYVDLLDHRLRNGQGWFIFNASGSRLNRIAGFIQAKLDEDHSAVNSYLMPWRDFAISAYVNEIGLSEITPPDGKSFQS